jgi:alkylation response protein AidB-like acyl-CoA dehydrogenase
VVVDPATAGVERITPGPGFGLQRTAGTDVVVSPAALRSGALLAEGEPGRGALEALLAARRILIGAIAVGLGKRVAAISVGQTRAAPARPTQLTDFALSDVTTELDAASMAVLNAAWLRDSGAPHRVESAGARLFAARAATKMAHAAIEVCGGADPGGALRRAYVDARALELFDGSLGPQVDIIASTLLEER